MLAQQLSANRETRQPTADSIRRHPNRPAIRRYPSPATIATIAAPITATSSWRRNRHTSSNSTCVAKHARQRARRGVNHKSPDPHRSTRPRAGPHGPATPDTPDMPTVRPSTQPRPAPARRIRSGVPPPASKRARPGRQARGRALAISGTSQACQPSSHAANQQHHHALPCRNQTALNNRHQEGIAAASNTRIVAYFMRLRPAVGQQN